MTDQGGRAVPRHRSSPSALAAQRRLEEAQPHLVEAIRESAERWLAFSTTLLAAVGFSALIAGPGEFAKLEKSWDVLGGGLFFVGALFGVIGTFRAATAAQRSFRIVRVLTGRDLLEHERTAATNAAASLASSQRAVAAAVATILLSALVLWTAPGAEDSEKHLQGLTADGEVACGNVVDATGPAALHTASRVITLASLREIKVVTHCPQAP